MQRGCTLYKLRCICGFEALCCLRKFLWSGQRSCTSVPQWHTAVAYRSGIPQWHTAVAYHSGIPQWHTAVAHGGEVTAGPLLAARQRTTEPSVLRPPHGRPASARLKILSSCDARFCRPEQVMSLTSKCRALRDPAVMLSCVGVMATVSSQPKG